MNLLPKEHGASVMFGGSLLAGWGSAGWRVHPGTVGMFAALVGVFFLREPVVTLGKRWDLLAPTDRRLAIGWGLGCLLLHLAGVVPLLFRCRPSHLALLAVLGLAAWLSGAVATIRRQDWHWWVDVVGAVSAALAAPAMMLAATGSLSRPAAVVWLLLAVFLLGGTLHLRVILRNGPRFRDPKSAPLGKAALWSVASVAAAAGLAAIGALPPALAALVAVALLRPLVLRGWVLERLPRIGLAESLLTAIFVAGVVVGAGR